MAAINDKVYNFRMTTCYVMLTFAFIILTSLGIYFSQVLPSAGGLRQHPCFCFGSKKKQNKQKTSNEKD